MALTAIRFADHLDEQPDTLLRLSEEMMARGEDDQNIHYRSAAAMRRLAVMHAAAVTDHFGRSPANCNSSSAYRQ